MLSFFPAPGAARGEGENALEADVGADVLIVTVNSCGCVVCPSSSYWMCCFMCLTPLRQSPTTPPPNPNPPVFSSNVSQLAADLMVASVTTARPTDATLLGWIDSPFHVPMVGNEAFNRRPVAKQQQPPQPQPQLCLPLELHGLGPATTTTTGGGAQRRPLAIMQTRAPLLRGQAAAFAEALAAWVAQGQQEQEQGQQGRFGRVVVVAGSAPSADESVLDPRARLWYQAAVGDNLTPEQEGDFKAWAGRFGAHNLAGKPELYSGKPELYSSGLDGQGQGAGIHVAHVAHTGIAAPLLAACAKRGVPAATLYYFAAEGANDADAARLAHVLLETLLPQQGEGEGGQAPLPLVAPRSWESLFGRSRRREMEAF